MKASSYNFTFPYEDDPGKTVLYNSRTNALALIENEKYEEFQAFCKNGCPIEDEELGKNLAYGGFLIDTDVDELELLRFSLFRSRFDVNHMGLTIAPTSDCNFRCIYCYEKENLRCSTMTEEIQESVVNYVKRVAPIISDLHISWYGGEPLLALDIIERLTEDIVLVCKENKISYSASIVTNGYLLTPKVAKKLGELHISNIQITLDGSREQHDKRRILRGGGPTFDRIIENLKVSKADLPCRVSIRINVDKNNIAEADEVVKILIENDLRDICAPYLGMVENSNKTYHDSACFCVQEFSELHYNFKTRNQASLIGSYPQIVHNVCSADSISGIVIDSDGLIYKCWNDIGIKEQAIGSIQNDTAENERVMLDYIMYDPTTDSECKSCKYLPLCMGGCPHRRIYAPEIRCHTVRYTLDKYITTIAKQIKDRRADTTKANH